MSILTYTYVFLHIHTYSDIYIQKLHHFCNTSSPDDGPKLDRKYLGNN